MKRPFGKEIPMYMDRETYNEIIDIIDDVLKAEHERANRFIELNPAWKVTRQHDVDVFYNAVSEVADEINRRFRVE